MTETIGYYCLSYKHRRKAEIEKVLAKFGITSSIHSGVLHDDPRLKVLDHGNDKLKRAWSMCYGQLDMIAEFYASGKAFGIFMEDDIIIRNDFMKQLPTILQNVKILELDVLMMGYLCENEIDGYCNFPTIFTSGPFKYLRYPDNTWGCQMYLLTRLHAKTLLDKYYHGYAERTLTDSSLTHFSSDWTVTKEGKRALLYPLMAIEKFEERYENGDQMRAHTNCYKFSYRPELFD